MEYWIVVKYHNGKTLYVSGTDEFGCPIHSEKESEAYKFQHFPTAEGYLHLGYSIKKKYH